MNEYKISIKEAIEQEKKYTKKRANGEIHSISTPWDSINKSSIDGFELGTFNLFGGSSGAGKTTWAVQFAQHVAQDPKNYVWFFSFETDCRKLVGKMVSRRIRKSVKDIYTSKEEVDDKYYADLDKLNMSFYRKPMRPSQLKSLCETNFKAKPEKNHVVIIDHSLLLTTESGLDERTNIIALTQRINELKADFPNTLFLLLTQLNDGIEDVQRLKTPSQHYPRKKDIFSSKSTYHLADNVLVLMNPYDMGLERYGTKSFPTDGYLFLHYLKNRDGTPGVIILKNNLEFSEIVDLTPSEKQSFLNLKRTVPNF